MTITDEYGDRRRVAPSSQPRAEDNVRPLIRGAEPFPQETLDTISEELKEFRSEQWRMTPLHLIAILIERINWPQTKGFVRGVLGPEATDGEVVAAADRLTEWADKARKGMA